MDDDEIVSPLRSPNSSRSPTSNTNNYPFLDEEIPNSSDSILAGSPIHGSSSSNRSFEEEINSLDQVNGFSGGESEEDFMIPWHLHSSAEGEEESRNPNFRRRSEGDEDFFTRGGSQSPKRCKSLPEDRISALPDGVLLHILSLLPAKSAIRTDVLSKRWMHLWESSPNLIFHFHDVRGKEKGYDFYANAVNTALIMHSAPKIQKFHFHFHKDRIARLDWGNADKRLGSSIDSWLRFAKRHNVEELSLKFKHLEYELPKYMLNCSSLRKLSSKDCYIFNPEGQVSWGSLRELTIARSSLSDAVLRRMLLGSPMLECIRLEDFEIYTIDDYTIDDYSGDIALVDAISNSRLERMVIRTAMAYSGSQVEREEMRVIIPPSLKSLEVSGLWKGTRLVLLNASSIVNVSLELTCVNRENRGGGDFVDMFRQLIQQIDHAEQLTLGSFGVQTLSMLEDTISPSPSPNYHCKVLILNLEAIRDHELLGIAHLLHHFQALEKLVINFTHNYNKGECPSFGPYRKFEDIWSSQEGPSGVLLQHLKTIEFLGLVRFDDVFAGFVQHLLQNACVLERMVLRSKRPLVDSSSWYIFACTLLTIQKASPRAVVLLPDFHEHRMQ